MELRMQSRATTMPLVVSAEGSSHIQTHKKSKDRQSLLAFKAGFCSQVILNPETNAGRAFSFTGPTVNRHALRRFAEADGRFWILKQARSPVSTIL
jgi:hypothetical protein